ncbi:uncharacterized protein LOC134751827 [Cydia strobilella]|uniref:uncharacterized protein LOC134742894 n=1 Tax=Cydia strobilella TaxID=1100964 RepID=UPI00300529CC
MASTSANVMFGSSLNFDHRIHEWSIFKSKLFQFCTVNDINETSDKSQVKRRAVLLSALSEDTYRILRDLVAPKEVDVAEYKVLLEHLDAHFTPKKSTFAERYTFYKAEQRPSEELPDWAARVRSLAQYCGFKSELDNVLRDRFVLGLENVKEKEKLFAESVDTLTFSKAIELAQSVRCARLALKKTQQSVPETPVFTVNTSRTQRNPRASLESCEVCGYKNHAKEQCRFINYTCQKCKQKGHLKKMCKSKVRRNYFIAEEDNDIIQDLTN